MNCGIHMAWFKRKKMIKSYFLRKYNILLG
jgi:hypothetical protein